MNNDNSRGVSVTDSDKWGYLVCFGTVITFIAGIGHINSFGLIYRDFMADTKSTAKSLTTAYGVFSIMLAIGGLTLNVISKKISLRSSGIIGAVIMSIGSLTTTVISNTNQLPLTFGLLQGIGFGILVPVCYSTMNHYFVKKRTTVMSICKAIQGIVLIWYPQLIKMIMTEYGFRGTLLIISGISLHTFPGMFVMNTVAKKSEKQITRTANDLDDLENGKRVQEDVSLLNISEHNRTENNAVEKKKNEEKKKKNIGLQILNILNVKILKDPVYCNICIGQSFVNFSDLTFFMLLPMLLFEYGYDRTQVATCISICAGADVTGRCLLAVISIAVPINTRLLFYVATLCTLLIRIVILQIRDFVWVTIVIGMLGILRAWLHVSSPLVISDYVSNEDFPGAYSLFMLSAGVVNVIFSPITGLLKDVYEDYVPAFYGLTLCCMPCLLFWPVEYSLKNK